MVAAIEDQILNLLDDMQDDINWGGDEDSNGTLHPGVPDIDEYKEKVKDIFKKWK